MSHIDPHKPTFIMKKIITLIATFIFTVVCYADENILKDGITVTEATNILEKYDYSLGDNNTLPRKAIEGEGFIFSQLDKENIVLLTYIKESNKIKELFLYKGPMKIFKNPGGEKTTYLKSIALSRIKLSKGEFTIIPQKN